jgi:hypothetical protein
VLTLSYEDWTGNLETKSDVGRYQYDGAQPHAVTTAGELSLGYDGNGNQTARGDMTVEYTPFEKPRVVKLLGADLARDEYDTSGTRVVKRTGDTVTVRLFGLFEERQRHGPLLVVSRRAARGALCLPRPRGRGAGALVLR